MTGRDEKGRFLKGNGGGPGRPNRKVEAEYLDIMQSCVTAADWKAIVNKAKEQAKRGNPTARKWLSDYLVGVPTQNVKMTTEGDHRLIIEYVNDWRANTTANAASGPDSG